MSLKVLCYNILHGFHSGGIGEKVIAPFLFQQKRLFSAKKVVQKEKPDILVLIEACFGKPFEERSTGKTLFIDYKKEFNFKYHYHFPGGYEWGTSILSNVPFFDLEDFSQLNKKFIKSCFIYKNKRIYLFIVHPHPDLREHEKAAFYENSLKNLQQPCILVGDFNALSDEDNYDKALLANGFTRFMGKAGKDKVHDLLQTLSIPKIRRKGLIDTFIVASNTWDFTIPTDYLSRYKDSGVRIDYIFCSDDFEVKKAAIVKNDDTEKASDHYPVMTVLDLKDKI